MKRSLLILIPFVCAGYSQAQVDAPSIATDNHFNFPAVTENYQNKEPGFIGESDRFLFYSHFWLNMHHFLYNKVIVFGKSNIEETIGSNDWNKMNKNERIYFEQSLNFYSKNIDTEDLRTGQYNSKFKKWVVQQELDNFLPNEAPFAEHSKQLNKFRALYNKYYWDVHKKSNLAAFKGNIELITKYEAKFIEELVRLCKAKWQAAPIRIDISYNSKRDIPYTTTSPTTHIVMDSKNTALKKGVWFELLLHESSHHLISSSSGFVGGTIRNIVEVQNKKAPRQFWHGYLFYFSGKVAKEFLTEEGINDYELYMEHNRFFGPMYPTLEKYLPLYMENKASLAEVTSKIIKALNDRD